MSILYGGQAAKLHPSQISMVVWEPEQCLPGARGRTAVSRWRVEEELYGGRAALMSWRLQTGRTHQIRSAPVPGLMC